MYFKKKTAAEQAASTEKINGPVYIADPQAHKLRNHYLITHPFSKIVVGIGLVLLLIMLASIPASTARQVEQKPVILNPDGEIWTIPNWLTKPIEEEAQPISLNQFSTAKTSHHG